MNDDERARFRYAAAGLIKTLMLARTMQAPEAFSQEDLARWRMPTAGEAARECWQVLGRVQLLRRQFEQDFLRNLGSYPVPAIAENAESIDAIADELSSFIFGDLKEAIRVAARGEQVDWDGLANWQALGRIRDSLDRLPTPRTQKGKGGANRVSKSWTQASVNAAIVDYTLKHRDVLKAARANRPGAKKEVKKMFSRNKLADALEIPEGSRRLVGNSSAWQDLAREFNLRTRRNRGNSRPSKKVGIEKAIEDKAEALDAQLEDSLVLQETEERIEESIQETSDRTLKQTLRSILDALRAGSISAEKAEELAALAESQREDDKSRYAVTNEGDGRSDEDNDAE